MPRGYLLTDLAVKRTPSLVVWFIKLFSNKESKTLSYARVGYKDAVALFLESGLDLSCRDRDGKTLLHHVATLGWLDIARDIVVRYRADVNASDLHGFTPAHLAAKNSKWEILSFLLASGASPSKVNIHGNTVLHTALNSDSCSESTVRELVNYGVDLKTTNKCNDTPLHLAIKKNKPLRLVSVILWCSDPEKQDGKGYTSAHLAVLHNRVDLFLEIMCSLKKVDIRDKNHRTVLHLSALNGYTRLVFIALDQGCHPLARDNQGMTPLHLATGKGHVDAVNLLVQRMINNVDISDNRGFSATQYAVDKPEIMSLLLNAGADPNRPDPNRQTLLHLALKIIRRDNDSKTNQLIVISMLLHRHANPNLQDNNGDTPLHIAVKKANISAVIKIANYGADILKRNYNYETPLILATGNKIIKDTIIKYHSVKLSSM